MKQAKDYIVFPLDVPSAQQAQSLVKLLNRQVGMFKIGLELFIRTGPSLIQWIHDNSACSLFLDLKLHDIPATVQRAMQAVADLNVRLTTVHCGESRAMLDAAVQGGRGKVGLLGVTVLTSVGAADLKAAGYAEPMADDPARLVIHKAQMAKSAGLSGVVCSGREAAAVKQHLGSDFLAVTPGIRPHWGSKAQDDQRRIVTPAMAIADGADYVVIGRPIRDASDPVQAARRIADEIAVALERAGRGPSDAC
jgi:orotidine-5'-phosphate decarboxylase